MEVEGAGACRQSMGRGVEGQGLGRRVAVEGMAGGSRFGRAGEGTIYVDEYTSEGSEGEG